MKLYAINLKLSLSDGTNSDAEVVLLADDLNVAASSAANWLKAEKPWQHSENENRKVLNYRFGEPEELGAFHGFGVGTTPLVWKFLGVYQTKQPTPTERP